MLDIRPEVPAAASDEISKYQRQFFLSMLNRIETRAEMHSNANSSHNLMAEQTRIQYRNDVTAALGGLNCRFDAEEFVTGSTNLSVVDENEILTQPLKIFQKWIRKSHHLSSKYIVATEQLLDIQNTLCLSVMGATRNNDVARLHFPQSLSDVRSQALTIPRDIASASDSGLKKNGNSIANEGPTIPSKLAISGHETAITFRAQITDIHWKIYNYSVLPPKKRYVIEGLLPAKKRRVRYIAALLTI